MKHFKQLIIGIAIFALVISFVGCVSESKYEILQTELISTKAELETTQSDLASIQTSYNTLQEEKINLEIEMKNLQEESQELRDKMYHLQSGFNSQSQLWGWLKQDTTNLNTYGSGYMCEEFARDLAMHAAQDGYWIGLLEVWEWSYLFPNDPYRRIPYQYQLHAKNFVVIGNKIYEVEPQTDEIRLLRSDNQ